MTSLPGRLGLVVPVVASCSGYGDFLKKQVRADNEEDHIISHASWFREFMLCQSILCAQEGNDPEGGMHRHC